MLKYVAKIDKKTLKRTLSQVTNTLPQVTFIKKETK